MSVNGTKQTSRHVRSNVANGVKSGHHRLFMSISAYDPQRTFGSTNCCFAKTTIEAQFPAAKIPAVIASTKATGLTQS